MLSQEVFGKRIKLFRKKMNLTQSEVAAKIRVSEQAVSKWENGSALPDVCNLKLLAKLLHVSVDTLLDTDNEQAEKVIETVRIGGAAFEIVEKPETILAGKIVRAKDYEDYGHFDQAIGATTAEEIQSVYGKISETVLPIYDIHLSVNFWREPSARAFGFVRETTSSVQPDGVQVYRLPPSLYIRAYTDKATAQLMTKESCAVWELFAYIRNFFMPTHGFVMADNGAQELEVYDTAEHTTGYAYMPVKRV